jgi:hypothetical protein
VTFSLDYGDDSLKRHPLPEDKAAELMIFVSGELNN